MTLTERAEAFLCQWEEPPFEQPDFLAEACEIIKGLMAELAEAWSECRDNEALIKQLGDQVDGMVQIKVGPAVEQLLKSAEGNRGWIEFARKVGERVNCLYSVHPEANQHILDALDATLKTAKGTT